MAESCQTVPGPGEQKPGGTHCQGQKAEGFTGVTTKQESQRQAGLAGKQQISNPKVNAGVSQKYKEQSGKD